LKDAYPSSTIIFRVITLSEPRKADIIPYLEAENAGADLPSPPARRVQLQFYLDSIASFWEAEVNIDTRAVVSRKNLVGRHSYTDSVEMQESEIACLADPRVQAELNAMELPEDGVVCIKTWTYAPDGTADMTARRIMVSLQPHCPHFVS
jgi:primary-amine oxidase